MAVNIQVTLNRHLPINVNSALFDGTRQVMINLDIVNKRKKGMFERMRFIHHSYSIEVKNIDHKSLKTPSLCIFLK
jgi:hypothetical protein